MKKPFIPYSSIFESHLEDQIFYVNESLKENIHRFPELVSIELNGICEDDPSCVEFEFKFRDGLRKIYKGKRWVDEGALDLSIAMLEAYWGLNQKDAASAMKYATKYGIKALDEGIYNQLCQDYIYSTLPHTNGGEFLEEDYEFFLSLINELKAA